MFSNLSMPLRTLFIILTAFLIAFASTPIVKTFAVRLGAIDVPDGKRRVHDHPIPRMGGMAIYLGFLVAIVMFTDITKQVQGLIIGSVI
ncbi:MAG: undecaprenyl/decaprenyl-phosphate alpha-N-acetylglucosaminyl 1-phosphate transferase, partial [Oscillospiraceae bacterium]|nr:undecaprenyl/decaprenyl-phosphate alpha-N-acetylglucosaminyl 1-phosphate transferase [Oscillospiraceae bacterium]